jgi:hypothetical protein
MKTTSTRDDGTLPIIELASCPDAATIQRAIDRIADSGGVVQLPETEVTIDRGIELRSGVALRGVKGRTVLRKGPGRVYPLSGYHNYGMMDVPLLETDGLLPGMTVSVLDDKRGGFYSTFARITWVDAKWVGLDRGIEADYAAGEHPRLTTSYPLVFGHGIRNAGVYDLLLDGNLAENAYPMDGCRGGAIYFARSHGIEIEGIVESNYRGEGLSFQMCTEVTVRDSSFDANVGNGLHPGAGSTGALFERCRGRGNRKSGFFFCVRANHITVRGCEFSGNAVSGINIGTRDSHNLIEECDIRDNDGPGILFRGAPAPIDPHSCRIASCRIHANAVRNGTGQIDIEADAHDLVIERNTIGGNGLLPAVSAAVGVSRVFLEQNDTTGCRVDYAGAGLVHAKPDIRCGYATAEEGDRRHLAG